MENVQPGEAAHSIESINCKTIEDNEGGDEWRSDKWWVMSNVMNSEKPSQRWSLLWLVFCQWCTVGILLLFSWTWEYCRNSERKVKVTTHHTSTAICDQSATFTRRINQQYLIPHQPSYCTLCYSVTNRLIWLVESKNKRVLCRKPTTQLSSTLEAIDSGHLVVTTILQCVPSTIS